MFVFLRCQQEELPGDFFTATGPFAELNKKDTYVEMSQNDLAELDKEVERISKKSPKDAEGAPAEPEESEEPLNTRNFNTLPRNYSDSLDLKKEKDAEEQKSREQQQFGRTSEFSRSEEHFARLLRKSVVKIVIEGVSANSMQSAQNLIPYLNFASLLRRRYMDEEALEVEMLAGLSLLSSRRYSSPPAPANSAQVRAGGRELPPDPDEDPGAHDGNGGDVGERVGAQTRGSADHEQPRCANLAARSYLP